MDLKCKCGAKEPTVCVVHSKYYSAGGTWYVACIKCGRVGMHGNNSTKAKKNWLNDEFLFERVEE